MILVQSISIKLKLYVF